MAVTDRTICSQDRRQYATPHQKQKPKWSLTPPPREAKGVFTTKWVTTTIHITSQEATARQHEDSTRINDSTWTATFSNPDEQANGAAAASSDDDLYHFDKHGIPDFWQRRHISASPRKVSIKMGQKIWAPSSQALDKRTYRNMRPAFQLASYILQKSESWTMRLIDAPTVMHRTPGSDTASLQLDPLWKPTLHAREKLQIAYDSLNATMRLYTAHEEDVLCARGHENPHGMTSSWLDQNMNVNHDVSFNGRYHAFFSREDYRSLPRVTRNAVSCIYAIVLVHEMCHCLWKVRSAKSFAQGEGGITGLAPEAALQRAITELPIVVPGMIGEQCDIELHWEMYLLGGMLCLYTEKGIWDGVEDFALVQGLSIYLPEGITMINEFAEAVFDEEVRHQVDECHEQAKVLAADTGVFHCFEHGTNLLDGFYAVIEGTKQEESLRELWRVERCAAGYEAKFGKSCMPKHRWEAWERIQRECDCE